MQLDELALPLFAVYLPFGQKVHEFIRERSAYLPGGHVLHPPAAVSPYFPAGHD